MNCFECNQSAEIKKYKAYLYEGISLENVHLFNVDVMHCADCKSEMLILPRPAKLHLAIGIAVVLQPARLSGEDAKFLRRNAGFSLKDWVKRIGIAEATYSKLENSHRPVSVPNDRLIRVNYLNALKQKHGEAFHLAKYLETALSVNTEKSKDFAIAVNAENPESEARYLPYNSPLLTKPETFVVEAKTLPFEPLATVRIVRGHSPTMSAFNQELAPCEKNYNASVNFTFAA